MRQLGGGKKESMCGREKERVQERKIRTTMIDIKKMKN